jgi:rhamnosyltransferase
MISIIIPTFNASNLIPDLLKSLNQQTVRDKEIIIIDSSSTDNTLEIARLFKATTLTIPKEQFDHGGTRNLGALKAGGDTLVYLTQDAKPASEYAIENLLKSLYEDKEIAASYGRQLPSPDASPFSAHLRLFNYPDTSYIRCLEDRSIYGFKTIFISNSFSAYRKNTLKEIGGFKENLIFGEDTHAAAQLLLAGYKVAYAADATVFHSHNYTACKEFKRYFDIGFFHRTEDWIVKEFGKTKGEGRKYVISEARYLARHKKYSLFPAFFLRSFLKYLGYSLGFRCPNIPMGLASKISMNKTWWEKAGNQHNR